MSSWAWLSQAPFSFPSDCGVGHIERAAIDKTDMLAVWEPVDLLDLRLGLALGWHPDRDMANLHKSVGSRNRNPQAFRYSRRRGDTWDYTAQHGQPRQSLRGAHLIDRKSPKRAIVYLYYSHTGGQRLIPRMTLIDESVRFWWVYL